MVGQIISIWTIVISVTFAYVFYNIWDQHDENKYKKHIIGIKYFAVALVIWFFSGVNSFFYYQYIETDKIVGYYLIYKALRTILSVGNSAFILLAINSIEVKEKSNLEFFKKDKKNVTLYSFTVLAATILFSVFVFSIVFDDVNFMENHVTKKMEKAIYFVGALDLLFALIVIWELTIRIVQSFRERNLTFMIPISWLLIAFIFISQLLEIAPFIRDIGNNEFYTFFLFSTTLIYKTILISLFVILLYSWQIINNKTKFEDLSNELKSNKEQNKLSLSKSQKELEELRKKVRNDQTTISSLENEITTLREKLLETEKRIAEKKDKLTKRELEILEVVNKKDSEIADILFITETTVVTHRNNIAHKLGLSGKDELIRFARDNNLLKPD